MEFATDKHDKHDYCRNEKIIAVVTEKRARHWVKIDEDGKAWKLLVELIAGLVVVAAVVGGGGGSGGGSGSGGDVRYGPTIGVITCIGSYSVAFCVQ